jgi:hypothetical protein
MREGNTLLKRSFGRSVVLMGAALLPAAAPRLCQGQVISDYRATNTAIIQHGVGKTLLEGISNASNPLPYGESLPATYDGYAATSTFSVSGNSATVSYQLTTGTPSAASDYVSASPQLRFTASLPFTYTASSSHSFSGANVGTNNSAFIAAEYLFPVGDSVSDLLTRSWRTTQADGVYTNIDDIDPHEGYAIVRGTSNGDGKVYAPGTYGVSLAAFLYGDNALAAGSFTLNLAPVPPSTPPTPPSPPDHRIINVIKYNDLNGDGVRQAGEPGMEGWDFNMVNGLSSNIGTYTTDSKGKITLDLPNSSLPFAYYASETSKPGWTKTSNVGTADGVIVSNNSEGTIEVGNQKIASPGTSEIQLFKFVDDNGNGKYDFGEQGLQGWAMDVLGVNPDLTTTKLATLVTDESGMAWYTANDILTGYQNMLILQDQNPGFLNVYSTGFPVSTAGQLGQVQTFQLATLVAVPEPTGLALIGVAATFVRRRRR